MGYVSWAGFDRVGAINLSKVDYIVPNIDAYKLPKPSLRDDYVAALLQPQLAFC